MKTSLLTRAHGQVSFAPSMATLVYPEGERGLDAHSRERRAHATHWRILTPQLCQASPPRWGWDQMFKDPFKCLPRQAIPDDEERAESEFHRENPAVPNCRYNVNRDLVHLPTTMSSPP